MSAAIPAVPVAEAIARIERVVVELGPERAALATDGDGTLWTHDIGEALFEAILAERLVGEAAREGLLAEADAHGVAIDDRDDAVGVARALFQAYVALKYPEDRMCAAMAWCMAGMSTYALSHYCDDLLERTFGLRSRFIEESLEVLRFAATREVPIWLVSASPRIVVERAAKMVSDALEIPSLFVIAMAPCVEQDVIRPGIEGTWIYGEGKRTSIEAALAGKRTLIAAMGDNVFDVPMLRASRVPIAIRPKAALLNVHEQVRGLITLAR